MSQPLLEIVRALETINSAATAFYAKLMEGAIEDAKKTFYTLRKAFGDLKTAVDGNKAALQRHTLLSELQDATTSLFTIFSSLEGKISTELTITDVEFAEEPKTYKALLEDAFKKTINSITSTVDNEKERIEQVIATLDTPGEKAYFDIERIERTKDYEKARKAYAGKIDLIRATENQIITAPRYEKKTARSHEVR